MNIPRESVEYLPLTVTLDGEATDDFEVSVVAARARPATWTAAPYLVDGLGVGRYDAWVRVTDNPETPAVFAGSFFVT